MSSNQVQFDETVSPFRKKKVHEQYQWDYSTEILFSNPSDVKWVPYTRLHISKYNRVYYDSTSDVMVMQVNWETNMYIRVTHCWQLQWLKDKLALSKAVIDEEKAILLEYPITHWKVFQHQ